MRYVGNFCCTFWFYFDLIFALFSITVCLFLLSFSLDKLFAYKYKKYLNSRRSAMCSAAELIVPLACCTGAHSALFPAIHRNKRCSHFAGSQVIVRLCTRNWHVNTYIIKSMSVVDRSNISLFIIIHSYETRTHAPSYWSIAKRPSS